MYCDKMLKLKALYRTASLLAAITIGYNLLEGIVSVLMGAGDETLSLFGFGLDSFVEVISGFGIWHMLQRLQRGGEERRDEFERRALLITGGAFYLLTVGLVATAVLTLWSQHRPLTTFWGVVVAIVSIASMWLLIHQKMKVGRALNSPAIIADAACTRTCLQLSVVLLAASIGYELTGIGALDAIGSLLIALLSWREGREALQKARGFACTCAGSCSTSP